MLDSQYLVGSFAPAGHCTISHCSGRVPATVRGMSRLAGRTRRARKRERIAALGLLTVGLVPVRQVMVRSACCPAAIARARGLVDLAGEAGGPRPPAGRRRSAA